MTTAVDSFLILAIPLFYLAGELMNACKLTDRIAAMSKSLMGLNGKLAQVDIFAGIIFAGMSGSATADTAALGSDSVSNVPPVLSGEDFALFTEKVPGAIFRVGCGNQEKGLVHPLHSPYFDMDEKSLVVGMNVFLKAAKLYLR